MGLFDKVFCDNCPEEAKLLRRLKLQDGKYLCSKCRNKIPEYMMGTVREHYLLEDYKELLDYIDYSNKHLRPQYHETHRYHSVGFDFVHGIFYLGYDIKEKSVFLDVKNVTYFDLVFEPEEIKEGIIGTKVKGDVRMVLEMNWPPFVHGTKVAYGEKAKAKKSFLGNKITYDNPVEMSNFLNAFLTCCVNSMEDDNYENNTSGGTQSYTSSSSSGLQKAMALFMFDDLENITVEKVKMQRNRLINTFHPDKGNADDTNYAQRINNAYEVLTNYLKTRSC